MIYHRERPNSLRSRSRPPKLPDITLIQFPHQEQTTVGGDARTLEINFQRRVKRELRWLILFLTHRIEPP